VNFLPVAGVFTENASDAVSTMVAFTGLLCGAAHYGAILARRKKSEVDRATGFAFFIGMGLGFLLLVKDYLR
jgi:ABC-type Mn2+/Zn2+ transport system permease subunit